MHHAQIPRSVRLASRCRMDGAQSLVARSQLSCYDSSRSRINAAVLVNEAVTPDQYVPSR